MSDSMQTWRGGTRLIFDSIEGITNTVERMHGRIAQSAMMPLPRDGRMPLIKHTVGPVYSTIRGVNGALRTVADAVFELLPTSLAGGLSGAEIGAWAALNGAIGDHLEATGNALAIPMTLLTPREAVSPTRDQLAAALPGVGPHLLLLVHGLGMSELGWNRGGRQDIGDRLRQERGHTPLYLRYNTGRHISTNGRDLARLIERLHDAWPVPLESVSLIGHSMGGLVIRSACWYAQAGGAAWPGLLRKVVFLGTPHHGSPLERAGHAFDMAMSTLPHTEPLLFGKHRSAGIRDLHHGNLLDEDWQGQALDRPRPDNRRVVPLLPGVAYYFAAASIGRHRHDPLGHALGDLLVRLDSATGHHRDDLKRLRVPPQRCRVFQQANHFDLLDDERVHRQILAWFDEDDGDQ